MTTAREFQDVESDYDALEEFFSDAFEFKGKQRYELGYRRGLELGRRTSRTLSRTLTIRDIILKNYRVIHGVDLPKTLAEKLDAIDSYRALEEIQSEVWSSPSVEAFERRVDSIIEQFA